MQNKLFFTFMLLLTVNHTAVGIITFFLKPYPYPANIDADTPQEIMRSMRNPGNMALQNLKILSKAAT